LVSSLFPLLGTRTGTQISILQYAYYLPIYLIGIYVAKDYFRFISFIEKRTKLLVLSLAISSILIIIDYETSIQIGWVNIRESFFYIQKISLCFLSLLLFARFESKRILVLEYFAKYAFTIFLMHTIVGNNGVKILYYNQVFAQAPRLLFPLSVLLVVVISCVTLMCCYLLTKIMGKRFSLYLGFDSSPKM
jgi:hypothetical protein